MCGRVIMRLTSNISFFDLIFLTTIDAFLHQVLVILKN